MRINRAPMFRLAALVVVLLIVAGCAPLPAATPTTGAVVTFTPVASATPGAGETPATAAPGETTEPTATTQPTQEATGTTQPTEGATGTPPPATATPTQPSVGATATAQPTNTQVPPTATAQPTNTPVPPTATPQPTNTPVPPTATPTMTPTPPPPQITDWRGEYFDDLSLQPPAVVVRNDRVVDFQWAAGESPAAGIPTEGYSARWSRDWNFDTGNYRFEIVVDDGARLWVDDNLIIDAWTDGAPREYAANLYLQGQVPIRLEYYNRLGGGRIRLNWDRVTSYPDWLGSYYRGRDLSGLPYFQRNDANVDFNWGADAPRSDMPADNFSVRWSRRVSLDRAGTYRFRIVADDGVRFWVDDRLAVDAWSDGYSEHDVSLDLAAGGHDLRLDYYEHLGGALVRLTMTYVGAPATATSTPTPTPTSPPPTATFTPTATGQPPTATSTPTATGQPPTATFTPTPPPPTVEPPPPGLQPSIRIESVTRSAEGQTLQLAGSGWPANTRVDLFLNRVSREDEVSTSLGQATTDAQGNFQAQVLVPAQQGPALTARLEIVARTADGAYEARTIIRSLIGPGEGPTVQVPGVTPPRSGRSGGVFVPFDPIQASDERFAVSEPTYLVLDSAEAWAANFGEGAPPADPPIDWEREYVVGAFLGSQPAEVDAQVETVTTMDGTVVVQLSSAVPAMGAPAGGRETRPGTLIRIPRAEVERAVGSAAEPSFAIVDASGALLAQGTPGAQPLGAAMALQSAPAPSEPGALALPEAEESAELAPGPEAQTEAEVEAEAAKEPFVAETEPEAAAEPVAEARGQAESAPRTAVLGWVVLALWVLAVAALIAGAWFLIRRAQRD